MRCWRGGTAAASCHRWVHELPANLPPMMYPADISIYRFFPAVDSGAAQVRQGGRGYNPFNGHGQVNALTAVGS